MNFRKSRLPSRRNSLNFMINAEKWRHMSRKLTRQNYDFDDDSEDEEVKPQNRKFLIEEYFGRQSVSNYDSDQDLEVKLTNKQTLILSTLLPDEILLMEKFNPSEPSHFVGVLLMADVSGFTALSERYNNTGKGGTYRLTVTLNTYLGSLIELIYSHGGDVLKFAGDAFLALWKTDKRYFISHTIHTVITCALIIQHSFASYETDVKVNLRVKLAISAGNLIFSPIGAGTDMNYVVFGLPVIEAKMAESICLSGEVKLTPTAWAHCYSRNYDYVIDNNNHVTIRSILYDPREKDVSKPFQGLSTLIKPIKKPFNAIENLPDYIWDSPNTLSPGDILKRNENVSLRKTILVSQERQIGSDIRKFMIRPILTQVDAHQPLEYLTEMRQVSVLFITLKPKECKYLQLITIVNNAYQITCEIVYKSMGCVNKIILFDKDIMILVVFGLRGFKHESEAQAALKCAYGIKKSLSLLDGVQKVSIGVTTGQVYSGVVGHPLRREFTVIGAIVNKAARLMCYYSNKITCDELTFVKCKMSSIGFTLQERIELKGIKHPGKIYEYTEEIRVKELHDIPMIPPLLDRSDEIEYFENWIDDSHTSYRDFDALLLIGESRIGKSRLLEWLARHVKNNGYSVCFVNLTSIHSATPYLALSQIINQILGLTEPVSGFTKEERIVQLLTQYDQDLCYLNNILKVRFAYHDAVYTQDENKRLGKAKRIFSKLIGSLSETHVVFFDDFQNLDPHSWEFISLMLDCSKIFTAFTVTRGKFSAVHNWLYNVFIHNNIRKIILGPLESEWIPSLACQILDVNAVPTDLCEALKTKCKGMPGLIESFIVHLFSTGALELKKIKTDSNEWKTEDLQFPDPELLHPQALDKSEQATLDEHLRNDDTGEIGICIVTQKDELNSNINTQNLDTLIMIQIDSLTPYQQLLLKISSVIGSVISRNLLENIMYENDPITTAKAIKRLFSMGILTCATSRHSRSKVSNLSSNQGMSYATNINHISCDCNFEYDPETSDNLPKYAFCKVLKFRQKKSKKICYDLLPINQKKEFHTRIVNFLENNKEKCPSCGGTIMVVQSIMSFHNFTENESNYNSIDENRVISNESQVDIESVDSECTKLELDNNLSFTRTRSENLSRNQYNEEITKAVSAMLSRDFSEESHLSRFYRGSSLKSKHENDTSFLKERSNKRVTLPNMIFKTHSTNSSENLKVLDMLRDVSEAGKVSDWDKLGIVDSEEDTNIEKKNRTSFSVKIDKGLLQNDYRKCRCAELNILIYEQLVYHAQQADLKIKSIELIIMYCYLNLLIDNVDIVFPQLEEAETLIKESESDISVFDRRKYLGKILSLKSTAHLLKGNLSTAKLFVEKAARMYRINFHKVSDIFELTNFICTKIKQKKFRQHDDILKSDSIFCLNVATLLYSALGDIKTARTSALKALFLVQKVNCNVLDLCDTFNNAIQLELNFGNPEYTANIEFIAKESLKKLSEPIHSNELHSIGKLFNATFRARIARGQLEAAIRSGFRALAISRYVQAENVTLDIIPDLYYVLITRQRIDEAVEIVLEIFQMGQNRISYDCEMWYYALCIDMILDAGFQLESPYNITRFAGFMLIREMSIGSEARRRLVTGLWTYWLRVDNEKKAKRFESEALTWGTKDEHDNSLTSMISAMRLAEGMLECLARKVDDLRKVVDLMALRSLADRELTKLETNARNCRTVLPHWMLLKYNSQCLSGQSTATSCYNQSLDDAKRMLNSLEEATIQASSKHSSVWLQNARNGRFPNWRDGKLHAETDWSYILYSMTNKQR